MRVGVRVRDRVSARARARVGDGVAQPPSAPARYGGVSPRRVAAEEREPPRWRSGACAGAPPPPLPKVADATALDLGPSRRRRWRRPNLDPNPNPNPSPNPSPNPNPNQAKAVEEALAKYSDEKAALSGTREKEKLDLDQAYQALKGEVPRVPQNPSPSPRTLALAPEP